MKLAEKGHFAPPPRLKARAQRVSETVASWPGVHARTHWLLGDQTEVDGADFYLGDEELGHIHLDSEAHIMLPRALADALIQSKRARRFPWSRDAVVCPIESAADVELATWIFELSYARRQGTPTAELVERVHAAV